MRLDVFVGQEVTVERRLGGNRWKGSSRVIGARPARYLLLEMPKCNGNVLLNAIGQKCVIHYFRKGVLTGFAASVLKIQAEPFPMVIMEYSDNMQEVTVRQNERVDCHIPCAFSFAPPEENGDENSNPEDLVKRIIASSLSPLPASDGAIVDLSKGGCLISLSVEYWESVVLKMLQIKSMEVNVGENGRFSNFMGLNSRLAFALPLPAMKVEAYEVRCAIRWVKPEPKRIFMGLQFGDVDEELPNDIQRIIDHQREFFARRYEVG